MLEIVTTVRRAIENKEPLKQSDILALVATTEQLWRQTVDRLTVRATGQHRREYMSAYMRRYRRAKRDQAIAANTTPETTH